MLAARLATLVCLLAAGLAQAAPPPVGVHEIEWLVHEDLVTPARPLSFYQNLISQGTLDAQALLRGGNGPSADSPCCIGLGELGAVVSFSDPMGLSLLEISSQPEYDSLQGIGTADTTRAFIVQGISYCGGPLMGSALGCGVT